MRVLQVIPSMGSSSGGPPRSTLATCRALHRADPDVETVLLTTDEGLEPSWGRALHSRCPANMRVEILPGLGRHTARFSFSLLRWMRKHAARFDLVVIRALLHPLSSAAARVADAQAVPYLLVPHGTLSEYTFQHRRTVAKNLYYRLVDACTVERASAIRFTTRAEREAGLRLGFGTAGVVIPHPFTPAHHRESPSRKRDLLATRIRGGRVLFLSRLHPVKGLDILLDAFRWVLEARPSAGLTIAGSGDRKYERSLRSRARALGLDDHVRFPGFVEDERKRILLREADVFVLPSRYESFGLALVEAMDARRPVVTTTDVGLGAEISDAGAGRVVAAEPKAVASGILELLSDPGLGARMGRNGAELVRAAFDPLHVGSRISRLYRAAASGPERVREAMS